MECRCEGADAHCVHIINKIFVILVRITVIQKVFFATRILLVEQYSNDV